LIFVDINRYVRKLIFFVFSSFGGGNNLVKDDEDECLKEVDLLFNS